MPELLSLTRAARLVGVARGALQKRIRNGELQTFEGRVSAAELLRLYPQARLEDDAFLERLNHLREAAYAGRLRERILPDPEVLVARLAELSRELATAKGRLTRYRRLVEAVQQRLGEPDAAAGLRAWLWRELENIAREVDTPHPLIVKDNFLRIMAAHVRIEPSGHEFFVEGSDTLLEAALRAGLALNYGCSSGNCGLCKARIVSGQVKKVRPHDYVLSEADKAAGLALLCAVTAVTDAVIEAPEAGGARDIPRQRIAARVKRLEPLDGETLLLHLQTPRTQRLRFLAGQSVQLEAGGHSGEYPVASCPCDDRNLQFHLRRESRDAFAMHAAGLKSDDIVNLEGPSGDFVLREDSPRPLLFLAIDHGFAPIKSLVEHAMALDAAESIRLCWIARSATGHYLQNLCRSWADALDNFHYTALAPEPPRVASEPAWAGYGDAEGFRALVGRCLEALPTLAEHDVYLAGPRQPARATAAFLAARGLPPGQLFVKSLGGSDADER
jgi:CDP-4-dehydro-6-deoxyglucose reductase